jgi:hypothetical protein
MKTPWHNGGSPGGLLYNNDEKGTLAGSVLRVARTPTEKISLGSSSSSILQDHSRKNTPLLSTVLVNEKKMIFPTPKTTHVHLSYISYCCSTTRRELRSLTFVHLRRLDLR